MKTKLKDPRQVISKSWVDRSMILEEEINLYCWNRSLNASIRSILTDLTGLDGNPVACSVNQTDLYHQLDAVRTLLNGSSNQAGEAFIKDIHMIVYDFLSFSETRSGTMYLRKIDHNACSKFHTDGYYLRLFTTYLGPGTEWLPEDAVDRDALGTDNEQIVKDKSGVQRMEGGDVGILKGDLFRNSGDANGIVHRSPEIAGTGSQRIILRVDI